MSDVRVKTWPLAVVGSMMLHATVLTGLYALPASGAAGHTGRSGLGAASVLTSDTAPIYLIPDELPPDVAARLAKEQAALAKATPVDPAPKEKDEPLAAKPPQPLEPIPVPLGAVDGSKVNTESWLKSTATGENVGIPSLVDQAQMDLKAQPTPRGDPGQGGQDGMNGQKSAPAPAPAAVTPAPTVDPAKAEPKEAMGPPAPEAAAVKAEAPVEAVVGAESPKSPLPEGPSQPEINAGNSGGETPAKTQPATAPAAHPAPVEGKPGTEASPASTPAAPAAAPASNDAPGAPGSPGVPMSSKTVPADRDADAASVKRAAVFRNGKVDAGEGLDIRTVRPEFSITTRALIQPGSPTLEIIFGKDGRARRVRVLKSSGFPTEVDGPVVTALYNWRAKGRVLDELPKRPDSTVSLEITIILQ